jgi:hypothetical protein
VTLFDRFSNHVDFHRDQLKASDVDDCRVFFTPETYMVAVVVD